MGFVLLGIATLTATGFQAALIGNIAHGIITGLLFFLAGAIKDRAHTGELAELGGLREVAPGPVRRARLRRHRLASACPGWPASGARRSRSSRRSATAVHCGPRWACSPRSAGRWPPPTSCDCCGAVTHGPPGPPSPDSAWPRG